MRNGGLYRRRPWALGIPAIDCGYLGGTGGGLCPTPAASDSTTGSILNGNTEIVVKGSRLRVQRESGDFGLSLGRWAKLLPTPCASEDRAHNYTLETSERHLKEGRQTDLDQAVRLIQVGKLLPTPVAYDATPGGPGNHYKGLGHRAKHGGLVPTPNASNGLRGGSQHPHRPFMLGCPGDAGYGMLNPEWVGWLMGFPNSWMGSAPLGTHRFRKWLLLHS